MLLIQLALVGGQPDNHFHTRKPQHFSDPVPAAVQEASLMVEPVDTAIRVLAHRGPTWRAPLVIDVLRSLPIMRQASRSQAAHTISLAMLSRVCRQTGSAPCI